MKIWRLVTRCIGGVHMFGPLWVVAHDHGLTIAWKQIVRYDWPRRT